MLKKVLVDLRVFMLFYITICFLFGMIFCVLGKGNNNIPGAAQDKYLEAVADDAAGKGRNEMYPSEEYKYLDFFLA